MNSTYVITPTISPSADVFIFEGDILDLINQNPDLSLKLVVPYPFSNLGKSYESRMKFDDFLDKYKM